VIVAVAAWPTSRLGRLRNQTGGIRRCKDLEKKNGCRVPLITGLCRLFPGKGRAEAEIAMSLTMSLAVAFAGVTTLAAPELSHFPDSYFDTKGKVFLQRRAMEAWPGPSQLVHRWRSDELTRWEKMAVLLGASASHDRVLLPLYREAVTSASGRLRMAAAYGYRELLGDALPNISGGVDLESAHRLAGEIELVTLTLRERPLVEFWLQAVLANENLSMPGWRGVVLRRPTGTCLRAVERTMVFDDLPYLITAYRLSEKRSTRVSLMKLLQALTLQKFLVKPADPRTGWGSTETDRALAAADAFVREWVDVRCTTDPVRVLRSSMDAMGVHDVDPLTIDAYYFWQRVLKQNFAAWHPVAARQLYDLGGRWSRLSVLQAGSERQNDIRDKLIAWYRLLPAHILARGRN
jgi:hypothetical protein